MFQAYEQLMEPITTAIRRELAAIIAKLHRVDFGKDVDPMSGMGGSSFYMKDLVEKLSFVKTEILSKFTIGEAGRTWFVAQLFHFRPIDRPLNRQDDIHHHFCHQDFCHARFNSKAFRRERKTPAHK